MNLSRIYAIVIRIFYLVRKNPARSVPLFAWSALNIILWGFITKYVMNASGSDGFTLAIGLMGGIVLWEFLSRVMHGYITAFLEDMWSRNFLNLFASPLSISEYVIGLILSSAVTSIFSLAITVAIAQYIFGISMMVYGIYLIPILFSLYIFGVALGVFGTSLMFRWGPSAEWFMWPIPAIIVPFVGVFYPVSVLPQWMQEISFFLAPTHVFEGMRAILAGGTVSKDTLWLSIGLSFLALALAYALFVAIFRRAVRTGLLARYTAESF